MQKEVTEHGINFLRLVEVSGSPHERGYQYGEQLAAQIQRLLREEFYESFSKENVSRESLLNYARKHLPYIEEYSQAALDTIKGIAEGSGRLLEEIVLIQMHEDVKVPRGISPLHNEHCTAFGCTGPATADGETYIGQNWDFPVELYWNGEVVFLLHEKNPDGPNILAYSAPGFLAWAGMNSNGISLSWNSVPRTGIRVGVPTYVIVSEILRSKNIGEALAAVVVAKRAGCFNFVIADENGEIYDIEATPDDANLTYCDKILGHANHYLKCKCDDNLGAFVDKDKGASPNLSTVVRQNRIDKLLAQSSGKIDLEVCKTFLTDHVNFPHSICSHSTDTKPTLTFDSWIMMPRKREWWIARYPPCQKEYTKYSVN